MKTLLLVVSLFLIAEPLFAQRRNSSPGRPSYANSKSRRQAKRSNPSYSGVPAYQGSYYSGQPSYPSRSQPVSRSVSRPVQSREVSRTKVAAPEPERFEIPTPKPLSELYAE